jgi:hypothetical protein
MARGMEMEVAATQDNHEIHWTQENIISGIQPSLISFNIS